MFFFFFFFDPCHSQEKGSEQPGPGLEGAGPGLVFRTTRSLLALPGLLDWQLFIITDLLRALLNALNLPGTYQVPCWALAEESTTRKGSGKGPGCPSCTTLPSAKVSWVNAWKRAWMMAHLPRGFFPLQFSPPRTESCWETMYLGPAGPA